MKTAIAKALGIRKKLQPESPWAVSRLRDQFPEVDLETLDIIHSVESLTMTSPERVLALCDSISHIVSNGIPGAIVECGVWRGGSMVAAASKLQALGATDRELWLYDTFEGMSAPTSLDRDFAGRHANQLLSEQDPGQADSVWCRAGLQEVKNNLERTGYAPNRIRYVEGKVEETLEQHLPDQIAILRLDTDWYESTRCEMENLFPRLSNQGVLIIDDYGHWNGCRKAIDEYLADNRVSMFLHRIDYTGRLGIKTV